MYVGISTLMSAMGFFLYKILSNSTIFRRINSVETNQTEVEKVTEWEELYHAEAFINGRSAAIGISFHIQLLRP